MAGEDPRDTTPKPVSPILAPAGDEQKKIHPLALGDLNMTAEDRAFPEALFKRHFPEGKHASTKVLLELMGPAMQGHKVLHKGVPCYSEAEHAFRRELYSFLIEHANRARPGATLWRLEDTVDAAGTPRLRIHAPEENFGKDIVTLAQGLLYSDKLPRNRRDTRRMIDDTAGPGRKDGLKLDYNSSFADMAALLEEGKQPDGSVRITWPMLESYAGQTGTTEWFERFGRDCPGMITEESFTQPMEIHLDAAKVTQLKDRLALLRDASAARGDICIGIRLASPKYHQVPGMVSDDQPELKRSMEIISQLALLQDVPAARFVCLRHSPQEALEAMKLLVPEIDKRASIEGNTISADAKTLQQFDDRSIAIGNLLLEGKQEEALQKLAGYAGKFKTAAPDPEAEAKAAQARAVQETSKAKTLRQQAFAKEFAPLDNVVALVDRLEAASQKNGDKARPRDGIRLISGKNEQGAETLRQALVGLAGVNNNSQDVYCEKRESYQHGVRHPVVVSDKAFDTIVGIRELLAEAKSKALETFRTDEQMAPHARDHALGLLGECGITKEQALALGSGKGVAG